MARRLDPVARAIRAGLPERTTCRSCGGPLRLVAVGETTGYGHTERRRHGDKHPAVPVLRTARRAS